MLVWLEMQVSRGEVLYANFQYGRLCLLGDGITWEHIDQVHNEVMVEVMLVLTITGLELLRW